MPESSKAVETGSAETPEVRVKRHLAKRYFVRFHMGLIFSASTFAGVGASKLLLTAGMGQVLIRYPLAVVISYAVFLGLTRLWVYWVLSPTRKSGDSVLNNIDLDLNLSSGPEPGFSGFGGGSAGGGGATDSWAPVGDVQPASPSGKWFNLDFDFSLDDDLIWVILLLIVLVTAILGSGVFLIYSHPSCCRISP